MVDITKLVGPEYRDRGVSIEEEGDRDLVLRYQGTEIARVSKTGVTTANLVETRDKWHLYLEIAKN